MKIIYNDMAKVSAYFTNPEAIKNFKCLTAENLEKLDKLLTAKYPDELALTDLENFFATLPDWFKAMLKEAGCTAF